MVQTLQHDRTITPHYGELTRVSPQICRIVAQNPGPFTFTGSATYIIGRGRVAVIDPGPADETHVQAILRTLNGEQISHILVTHTHLDHSGAANPLSRAADAPTCGYGPHAEGNPVEAGSAVEEGADPDFVPDIKLKDGDRIAGDGWMLEAMHTPGHTSNHLCFALPAENALFTGDHVMAWSTTVIAPPEGNMTDYLRSLEKVQARGFTTLWPTHGPPVRKPHSYLAALLTHRREREAAILRCLARGFDQIPDIVEDLYAETPRALHPAAACSVLAHLIRLIGDGQVAADGRPALDSHYRLL